MTTYCFAYDLSNQLWLRIAGYLNYLSSTYVFISSLVSLTKYAGRKLKTVMWLRMAGKFMSTSFFAYDLSNQLWLRMAGKFITTNIFAYDLSNQLWLRIAGYLNYLSSTYVFISSFVSLKKYAGRKMNTMMWLRMAGKFMSTYFLRTVIWLMYHLLTADNKPGFSET